MFQMRQAILSIGMVATLAAAASSARAAAVVSFGTPSLTDVPAGSSSTFDLSWDVNQSGKSASRLFVRFQPDQRVSVTPSVSGPTINSTGTTFSERFSFSPTVPGTPVAMKKNYVGHVTLIKQRTISTEVQVGPDSSTDDNLLELNVDVSAPPNFTFANDPVLIPDGDNLGFTIQSTFLAPAGYTGDPAQAPSISVLSATAVPEPASIAFLVGAGALLACRRRSAV